MLFQEFNRALNLSEEMLMKQLFNHVMEGESFQVQVENDETILLQLKTVLKSNDRRFVWDFRLVKTSAKEVVIHFLLF